MRRSLPVRLTALACVALWPATHAAAQGSAQGLSPGRDPSGEARAVREARASQRSFEFTRRVRLPLDDRRPDASRSASYYGNGCPVRIGRVCWWDNNDDGAPPPEPASITTARTHLLDDLARAAAEPTNGWVAGQRVRYAIEARRPADALAAAVACGGSPTWCLGLRGVALHLANRAVDAAAAFDSADALRTPAERCAWYDVSPWLESGPARAYRRLSCGSPERARWESRFWRLAQPLWLLPVNDLRSEWNTRRVMARIHADAANPYGMSWGDDLAECELRYGWPTGWSTRESGASATSMYAFSGDVGRGVVGHEPAPSYDFVPRGGALGVERRGVADVPEGAWTLRQSPDAQPTPMRYAPAYAGGGVGEPTHQLARFRRGDTAVVVGAYDATRDSLWSDGRTPPALSGGLFVLDDSGTAVAADRRDSVARVGVLVARVPYASPASRTDQSTGHWLLGLEILQRDTVHTIDGRRVLGRALRTRAPFHPLGGDARLSDLLLLRHSPGPTPTLTAALDSAAGSLDVRRGGAGGIYWEQYADAGTTAVAATPIAAAPDTIVIAATRLTRGFRDRLADVLRRGTPERPIALRFPDPGGAGVGRAIGLTWPDVPAGDYRLDVTLVPGTPVPGTPGLGTPGRQPATSTLVVHIVED